VSRVAEMDRVQVDSDPLHAQASGEVAADARSRKLHEGQPSDGRSSDARRVARVGGDGRQPQADAQDEQDE
jgi:hypothetical protein